MLMFNPLIGVVMSISVSLSIIYHQFAMTSAWKRLNKTEILPAKCANVLEGENYDDFFSSLNKNVWTSHIQSFAMGRHSKIQINPYVANIVSANFLSELISLLI